MVLCMSSTFSTSKMNVTITTLPDEILLNILSRIDINSLGRIRGCNRMFAKVSSDNHLWKAALATAYLLKRSILPNTGNPTIDHLPLVKRIPALFHLDCLCTKCFCKRTVNITTTKLFNIFGKKWCLSCCRSIWLLSKTSAKEELRALKISHKEIDSILDSATSGKMCPSGSTGTYYLSEDLVHLAKDRGADFRHCHPSLIFELIFESISRKR